MKLFLDTEFTGLQQDAQLISLALVTELGHVFYAEFSDFSEAMLTDWHREHVLPYLFLDQKEVVSWDKGNRRLARGNCVQIREALQAW